MGNVVWTKIKRPSPSSPRKMTAGSPRAVTAGSTANLRESGSADNGQSVNLADGALHIAECQSKFITEKHTSRCLFSGDKLYTSPGIPFRIKFEIPPHIRPTDFASGREATGLMDAQANQWDSEKGEGQTP